jgi:hypothetical protein
MSNYTKTTNFAAKDSLPSGNAAKIVKGAEIDTEFNNIATASATKANANNAELTGTSVFNTLSDGAIAITGWVDEDNMSSNSAVLVPTQQSVKAYVDSNVTAQDLDVTDGSSSIDIDLNSEVLGILGGTGVTSTASGTGVTLSIDSTVATLTGSQTLTNKTLTAPVISGNLTTNGLLDGRDVATDGSKLDGIEVNADVTDAANVTAAGALMDSELTSIASVKALNQGVATTNSPTFAGITTSGTTNTANLTVSGAQGSDGQVLTSTGSGVAWETVQATISVPSDGSVTSAKLSGALTTPSSLTLGGNLDVSSHDIVTTSNGAIELDPNGSGKVVFKGNATRGAGQFVLNCEQNSHGITIKGPPHSANASYTLTLPNNDGDADQLLKTDGSGNLSWGSVAGSTLEAVASGTLSDGSKVIINADGTVSPVAESATYANSGTVSTESTFDGGSLVEYTSVVFDSNSNTIVVAYRDQNNSNYGTVRAGTVSSSTISWGTAVVFESSATEYTEAAFDSNSNKIVISYRVSGGKAIVGTVSGNNISFGTAVAFASNVNNASITFDSNSNKVVISYVDAGNSNYGTSVVGTVSGTSISFGTPVVFNSAYVAFTKSTFDSNLNKTVIAFRDGNNYGKAVVGTVSGTSISFGTPVIFQQSSTDNIGITFDSNANKVVIAYRNTSDSSNGKAIIGTVSGTAISFGTAVTFRQHAQYNAPIFDSTTGKIIIGFKDGSNNDYGTVIVGEVSGTSISFGSLIVFNNVDSTNHIALAHDSNVNINVIAYQQATGGANEGAGRRFTITQSSSSNLTTENYIGISNGAYANSATATIQLVGSVDDAQSGLTAGQSYYIQADGTLSTSAGSPSVFAGTAVSATKLIIKG